MSPEQIDALGQLGIGIVALIALIATVVTNNKNMGAMIGLAGEIAGATKAIKDALEQAEDRDTKAAETMRTMTADLTLRLENVSQGIAGLSTLQGDVEKLKDMIREDVQKRLQAVVQKLDKFMTGSATKTEVKQVQAEVRQVRGDVQQVQQQLDRLELALGARTEEADQEAQQGEGPEDGAELVAAVD